MLNDLKVIFEVFPHAVVAGVVIAAVCAFLGIFVILKRVVFIGVALSQVAAAGIAIAFVSGLPPYLGAGILTLAAVWLLACPYETRRIPRDAVMGTIFVAASGLSILVVAKSGFGLLDVQ